MEKVRKEQDYYLASVRYKIKLVSCRMPHLKGFHISKSECLPAFLCVAFASAIKLSLSEPMSFLTFSLPVLFPFPLGRVCVTEHLCGALLLAGVKP